LVKLWVEGVHYEADVVIHRGGTYQALRDTARIPGEHVDWLCLAEPGHDGRDGRDFCIRDTYDPNGEYAALDVVTMNAGWFVARRDNPGPCPGPDWKSGPVGKRGEKGERGVAGPRGEPGIGIKAAQIQGWSQIITRSDGSTIACDLLPLFELYRAQD
jgi:hypothetical protein